MKILRLSDVLSATGLSRSTVYRLIKAGEFPRQVQLSERAIGWREADVATWLAGRQSAGGCGGNV